MIPLLIVLAVLVLLALLPFGGEVSYDADGFTAYVRVLCFRFRVYPSSLTEEERAARAAKKKAKADKKAAKKAAKLAKKRAKKPQEEPEEKKKGGSLSLVLSLLPALARSAGRLLRKIRVNDLDLQVAWGASNPADAALGYGYASAAMGALWGALENSFRVKRKHLVCRVDYEATSPTVLAHLTLTITLGQALGVAVRLLFDVLKKLSARKSARANHKLTKEA